MTLRIILAFLILIFIISCSDTKQTTTQTSKQTPNKQITKTKKTLSPKIIKVDDLVFREFNDSITYHFDKVVILAFLDNSKLSQNQKVELQHIKQKFYIIKNEKLKNFFKIQTYPTIIVIEQNKTKKFNGFVPRVVLNYEIKGK